MPKSKKPKVSVVKESDTGRNEKFIDNNTGKTMTKTQFVKEIEKDKYPDYTIRKINNVKTPVSKPNKNKKDNLG